MGRRVVRTSSQDLKKLLLTPTGGRFFRPLDAFDEVYPGVLLGDASTALSTCLLKELKVTHVLNAAHGKNDEYYGGFVNTSFSNYDQAGIKFMGIQALDTPSFYLRSYFRQAADFISDAIRSGGKVLIHCQCGISRSATLVAAFLMLKKGMDAQQALSTIRAHRSIFPNQGFISQLCDFEYELKQAGSLPNNPSSFPSECNQTPKEQATVPAFHTDHRPTFTSTKCWPHSRPLTKSGYPVSSVFCDFDFEPELIPRSRSMDRYPSSYRARSSSPIPQRVSARSASLGPEDTLRATSLSPLSTYDITTTRPYVRPSYYSRTLADYYYTTPYLYEPYYYTSRYYSDYDYASPFATRYYNKYYYPRTDSYYYSYRDSPYLSSVYSSYVPLSMRYPYSSYRYLWA